MNLRPWLIVLIFAILVTGARASSCYAIRDMDKRLACLAEERRDPAGCVSIRNPDDREICRQRAGQRDVFGACAGRLGVAMTMTKDEAAAWLARLSDDEWPIGMRLDGSSNEITFEEHRALVEAGFLDACGRRDGDRPPTPLTPEIRALIDRRKAENRGPSWKVIDWWLRGSRNRKLGAFVMSETDALAVMDLDDRGRDGVVRRSSLFPSPRTRLPFNRFLAASS